MTTKTAIAFDDHVYKTVKDCSTALGQSMAEWVNNAARDAARKQNAAAYAAWIAETGGPDMAAADAVTEDISLSGAQW